MGFKADIPYNELPLLPPDSDIESKDVLKKAITANKALAELKGLGEQIPNQSILIRSISLQEAKLSSEIENIVTTNDELYKAFADDNYKTTPHTKEVLHYQRALWYGFDAVRNQKRLLTTNLFVDLYRIIKQTNAGIRNLPGTKLAGNGNKVVYTPPEGEGLIRSKLKNLEDFIYAENDIDPLIKLAVIHYQFEAIHPFTDGNGRTGRILNLLYLLEQNLIDIPVLYISRYIIDHKDAYYSGLRNVTENGGWEAWILYMLDAVEKSALEARSKILLIKEQMRAVSEKVKVEAPKIYSKDLIEILFRQPYCKIKFLQDEGVGNRQTASSYLKELEGLGILTSFKQGRELYYVNTDFLKLLSR